ncbi:MAG: Asp-tRNA(Asn)/Glu-tRNA(Gln) amidotransferase subunit GatC [Acutalibacteraceae bacterium]|nr:Asp-tRNA(Asn)/Glu-tRNA(Gln) amidotransferase subunit GatC [Clostridia bacterium]MEE1144911.1 Asp-tRNA(Asn)/Glu-tRNA(Gln) amidotransferase subunit GatC [Acutalibacteraceae bacterium]
MVTKEEILDIALLSKLEVTEDELDSLTDEMMNIIKFADTINSFDGEIGEFDDINGLKNEMRDDVVVESYDRERILANVNGGEDGYFPVKKKM